MSILLNLFGTKLRIRFEGVTFEGREFTGKTEVKVFACDEKTILNEIRQMLVVENQIEAKTLKITGHYKI